MMAAGKWSDAELLRQFRACSDEEQARTLRGAIAAAESGELGGWSNYIPERFWQTPEGEP